MEFTTDIEMLAECLKTKKYNILRFLKKNFKENIHYKKDGLHARIEVKRGGVIENVSSCLRSVVNS